MSDELSLTHGPSHIESDYLDRMKAVEFTDKELGKFFAEERIAIVVLNPVTMHIAWWFQSPGSTDHPALRVALPRRLDPQHKFIYHRWINNHGVEKDCLLQLLDISKDELPESLRILHGKVHLTIESDLEVVLEENVRQLGEGDAFFQNDLQIPVELTDALRPPPPRNFILPEQPRPKLPSWKLQAQKERAEDKVAGCGGR